MKAYVVRVPSPLPPFRRPASSVRFRGETIGSRLRRQLEHRGFEIVEIDELRPTAIERGSLVVRDDVVLSERFLECFLRAIPDPRRNYGCEIEASRFPLFAAGNVVASYRSLALTYYGDPADVAAGLEVIRLTPASVHEVSNGLPVRVHTLTDLRVHFLDFYGIQVEHWFDLHTATSLICREYVANLVRFARLFVPWFLLRRLLASRWLMERCNTIGRNCRIHPTAILEGCVVGDAVEIGPFAYLRMSVVADGAVVSEKASAKGSFLGEGAFLMGSSDVTNSYVGAGSAIVCPMLFNVVFGERAFISGGSGFADFNVGGAPVRVSIEGKEVDSGLPFLGSAVGDDCFLGANLIFAPGRTIPDGTRVLDHGLVKAVPGEPGGAFVVSGGTLLRIPDGFLAARAA